LNILFISFDADPPNKGGVSTVTNILAKALICKGHYCSLAYFEESEHPSELFENKIKLVHQNLDNIRDFFTQNKFDIILNQLPTSTDFELLNLLPLNNSKLISVYHNRPMLHPLLPLNLFQIIKQSESYLYKFYTLLKIALLPILNIYYENQEVLKYKTISLKSDKIILLSNQFFKNWFEIVPETDKKKLVAISNPLTFDTFFPIIDINKKENLVIVVVSLNHVKRAHVLLNIWHKLEKNKLLQNWRFEFVGDGYELESLKKQAYNLKLERIKFIGKSNPRLFYKRAKILMMTSKYEGWPMVLMEGQQNGVVPVSFNSFESIVEIISNNFNGIIVPNNDINSFVVSMTNLMLNEEKLNEMIKNAVISSHRFEKEKIVNQYIDLFDSLI
jgi:glycosyltransferase involved in cell wall biosynthesis